ncbi:MAG: hypothetical protein P4N60_16570 [Verrucomicrobiae bacterium]|nr:hypothetical protein [Verrucomicrobiae bacterium]
MNAYEHTQSGTLIIRVTLLAAAALAVGGCFVPQLFIPVPILLVTAWVFRSLTIEISGDKLRWQFGSGLVAKRVLLEEIASVKAVRTNFMQGWGIHWTRYGWLYNVAGNDAVVITLRNGKKFALGTDEPEVLCAIIQQNLR